MSVSRSATTMLVFVVGFSILSELMLAEPLLAQVTKDEMIAAYKQQRSLEDPIAEALGKTWTTKIEEVQLSELVEMIRKDFDINAKLDIDGLDLAGIGPDEMVSSKIKNLPLRLMLKTVLRDLDLEYIVKDGILQITSTEAASDELIQKIYDVSHLLPREVDEDSSPVRYSSKYDDRAARLEYAIMATIEPSAWEENGGTGTISTLFFESNAALLAVSQTTSLHEDLTSFLGEMTALIDSHSSSGNDNSSAPKKKTIMPDSEVTTFVYPIDPNKMKTEEAVELIETVFDKELLQLEKKTYFIKSVGKTIVIRNSKKIQDKIYNLLNNSSALTDGPNSPSHSHGGGGGGGGLGRAGAMGGGLFSIQ